MPALILEAPSPSAPAHSPWAYALTLDGESLSQSGHSAPALLPKPGKATQVVLVMPVQALSWHRVNLPQVSLKDRTRLRAVLAGLLEDQLLDDPAELHFALAPDARAGSPCWVVVCRAEALRVPLTALAEQGMQAQRIVPAFAPAFDAAAEPGAGDAALVVVGTEDAPWLVATGRGVAGGVLALPLTPSATSLEVVAASDAQTPLLAEPAVYQLAQQRLGRPAELLATGQRLLQASRTPWSLAQFQFANSGRDKLAQSANASLQALWRAPQWRWARWGAALLLLVNLLGINLWAWQARADLAEQRARINQLFTTTFPRVPVVVDAPLQMRQELQRLQQQSGALTASAFEVLAGAAGAGVPAGDLPQDIRYEDGRLVLTGLSQQGPGVSDWVAELQSRGLLTHWQEGALHIEAATPGVLQ